MDFLLYTLRLLCLLSASFIKYILIFVLLGPKNEFYGHQIWRNENKLKFYPQYKQYQMVFHEENRFIRSW